MAEMTYDEIENLRHKGGGCARIERESADSARSVIDSYFDDEESRSFAFRALSRVFEVLDQQAHQLGSVTLFNNRIHVNAGRILFAAINARAVLHIVDSDAICQ